MKLSGGGIDHGTIMASAVDSCQDRLPMLGSVGTAMAPTLRDYCRVGAARALSTL